MRPKKKQQGRARANMTARESRVLRLLGEAWNEFCKLPRAHQSDPDEFMRAIHAAQNIVLARPAQMEVR